MVAATVRITVVDGEVIPIENTPSRPPPLPEPPPWFHSDTSIDGDLILILILLFRLVYQVDGMYRVDTLVLCDTTMAEQSNDMVLYQIKYKTIRPFHLRRNSIAKCIVMNDNDDTIAIMLIHYDDDTIVIMQQYKEEYSFYHNSRWYGNNNDNNNLHVDVRYWYSTTIFNGEKKFILIRPRYLIYHDDDDDDKQLSPYQEDHNPDNSSRKNGEYNNMNDILFGIIIMIRILICSQEYKQEYYFYQDNCPYNNNNITGIDTGTYDEVMNNDNDNIIAIKLLVVLYQVKTIRPGHSIYDTYITEYRINSYTATIDIHEANENISTMKLVVPDAVVPYDRTDPNTALEDTRRINTNKTEDQFDSNPATIKDIDSMNRTENLSDSFNMDTIKDMDISYIIKDSISTKEDKNDCIKDNTTFSTTTGNTIATTITIKKENGCFTLAKEKKEDNQRIDTEDQIDSNMEAITTVVNNMTRPFDILQLIDDKTRADNGGNDTLNVIVLSLSILLPQVIYQVDRMYLIRLKNDKFSTSINGEKYTSQSKYKDDYIKCLAITTEASSITNNNKKKKKRTDDLEDLKKLYDDRKILNGEYYFVLSKDTLTNTTEDLIDSNMSILLYHDVHDDRGSYSTTTNDDDNTILLLRFVNQLAVLYQDVHNDRYVTTTINDKYKMTQPFRNSTTTTGNTTATTTVRRTISSTVSNLTSSYSTTTIDGELIVLFRFMYRVQRRYRVDYTIATMQLVALYQDIHVHVDIIYQIKYRTIRPIHLIHSCTVKDNVRNCIMNQYKETYYLYHDSRRYNNNNNNNGEYYFVLSKEITNTTEDLIDISSLDTNKILNGKYYSVLRKDTLTNTTEDLIFGIMILIGRILICSRNLYDNDDTIASYSANTTDVMQLVVLYQDKNVWYDKTMVEHTNDTTMVEHTSDMVLSQANVVMNQYDDKDYTIGIMQLVLYQDVHIKKDNIAIKQLARNCYSYKMKLTPTTEDPSSTDDNKTEDPTNKVKIKDSSYSNITNIDIGYSTGTSTIKENGEQTTCYSNQDPYMIQFCHNVIAIDCKDNIDMIATDTSFRLGHSKEKIDINETTTLIRMFTSIGYDTARTSIGDETTTSTIQNGEKNNQLDYNLEIVLIYDHDVISMIPVQLCLCILLIVTLRLLSQSMGSVKIHKAQVKRASQLNQASQMRARLEACLESGLVNQTSHESFGFAHPLFGSFSYGRSRIPL